MLTWTSSFVSVFLPAARRVRLPHVWFTETQQRFHPPPRFYQVKHGSRPQTLSFISLFKKGALLSRHLLTGVRRWVRLLLRRLLSAGPRWQSPETSRASDVSSRDASWMWRRRGARTESCQLYPSVVRLLSVSSFGSLFPSLHLSSFVFCLFVSPAVPPTPQPTDNVDIYFETPADDKEHSRFQRAKEQLEIRHRNRMERVGFPVGPMHSGKSWVKLQSSRNIHLFYVARNPGTKGVGRGRPPGEEPAEGRETDPDPGKTLILSSGGSPVFGPSG